MEGDKTVGSLQSKVGRVTLRQLILSSPVAWGVAWLVIVFFLGMGIFGISANDANDNYAVQRDTLSALRQIEDPAGRQLYAKAMLQADELSKRRSSRSDVGLGDELVSQLRIVADTGQVPSQNNRHYSLRDFWHGPGVWWSGAAAYFAFSLCLLGALHKIAEQRVKTMVSLLPWEHGWPALYALLVGINPLGLASLVASARNRYKLVPRRTSVS